MDVHVTLGEILQILSVLAVGLGIAWKASGLSSSLSALEKAVTKLEPHGVTVPLLQQQLTAQISEVAEVRKRLHDMANTVQWIVGRLEEIQPREPSRPDLTETPGRYPPRR